MSATVRFLCVWLWIVELFTSPVVTASVQTYTATLTGTVSDPSGAVTPNVRVVVTNQGTKLEYSTQSNDVGVYSIPFLPIGEYVVRVEAIGFKRLTSNPIALEVNQTAQVDLKLEIGDLSEEITVENVAPILQTESVTVSQVITAHTTANLPLNGRNFQQLTLLVAGTIQPNPGGFNGVGQGMQSRPYVNGNREQGNAFLLDGISVDETIDNRIGYKPNVDALAEFRVETSNSSAEFGNVTGATVNATSAISRVLVFMILLTGARRCSRTSRTSSAPCRASGRPPCARAGSARPDRAVRCTRARSRWCRSWPR